jgi:secreted trypsin-like serine protease
MYEWGHRSITMLFEEVKLDGIDTIIGGSEAIPLSRPYLVSLGGENGGGVGGHFCGGSLISPRAVLTAAHCIVVDDADNKNFDGAESTWVDFNRHNLTKDTKDEPDAFRIAVGPSNQVIHPDYNKVPHDKDVAIIILPQAVSGITPVTLNENPRVPAAGVPLDVAGWGQTQTPELGGVSSPVLKKTTLNFITNEQCTSPPFKYTPANITENMLCAFEEDTDSCQGDSGKCHKFFVQQIRQSWRKITYLLCNSMQVAL